MENQGWQPIETAPKDGTQIIAYCDGTYSVVRWEKDDYDQMSWCGMCFGYAAQNGVEDRITANPTHWMPLPEAPKE